MKEKKKWFEMSIVLMTISLTCGSTPNSGRQVISTTDPESQPTPARVENQSQFALKKKSPPIGELFFMI